MTTAHHDEATARAMRREEWTRAGELEAAVEARLGGSTLLTQDVMADVRELAEGWREELVAAERAWLAVEAQDDEERAA